MFRIFEDARVLGAYLTFVGVSAFGLVGASPIAGIGLGAVALLWLSDRGQHRELARHVAALPGELVILLSVFAHLGNNALFYSLAFGCGSVLRWLGT